MGEKAVWQPVFTFEDVVKILDQTSAHKARHVLDILTYENSPKWILAKLAKDNPPLVTKIIQLLKTTPEPKETEDRFSKDFGFQRKIGITINNPNALQEREKEQQPETQQPSFQQQLQRQLQQQLKENQSKDLKNRVDWNLLDQELDSEDSPQGRPRKVGSQVMQPQPLKKEWGRTGTNNSVNNVNSPANSTNNTPVGTPSNTPPFLIPSQRMIGSPKTSPHSTSPRAAIRLQSGEGVFQFNNLVTAASTGNKSTLDWDALDSQIEDEQTKKNAAAKAKAKIDWNAFDEDEDEEGKEEEETDESLAGLGDDEEETEEERKRREKIQNLIWSALDAEMAEAEEERKTKEEGVQKFDAGSVSPREDEEDRILRVGYLTKLGGKMRNWKKRWVVLDEKKISYYKKMGDKEKAGVIYLEQLQSIVMVVENKKPCIQLNIPERTFLLMAENKSEVDNWLYLIEAALMKLKLQSLKEKNIMVKVSLPQSQLSKLVKLDLFHPVEEAKKIIFSKFKGTIPASATTNEYKLYHAKAQQWLDDSKALLLYFLEAQDTLELRPKDQQPKDQLL